MGRPSVSVIVVSRARPASLSKCLTALGQLRYRPFEVVVVTDTPGRSAVSSLPLEGHAKLISFDAPGIAEARNLGIAHAGGDLVAFIDDDAVPEPLWLDHLSRPFSHAPVAASTGYVIGRNGISYQWRARTVTREAVHGELEVAGDEPTIVSENDRTVMTEGTNMAVRRSVLVRIGGFDPSFRFFLDDADMAIRLSVSKSATAVVPLAQVHHGFAASERRRADRMPLNLTDVGRSLVLFLRKHAPQALERRIEECRDEERIRLLRHMVAGRCEPFDVARILGTFEHGVRIGLEDKAVEIPQVGVAAEFKPYVAGPPPEPLVLSGRPWSRRRLRREASAAARAGKVPTVFRFSPTALYHRVAFREPGFWEQTGGVFGRADRTEGLFQPTSFRRRVAREIERVAKTRGISQSGPGWTLPVTEMQQ